MPTRLQSDTDLPCQSREDVYVVHHWCYMVSYSGFAEIAKHRVDEFEGLVDFFTNFRSGLGDG